MKAEFVKKFDEVYRLLSQETQKKFDKQLAYLLKNMRHPSLRAKKYDETLDIWQARVNGHFRFYFQIRGDTYYILNIRKHQD